MRTVLDTAGVPVRDRATAWAGLLEHIPVAMSTRFLDPDFHARVGTVRLGDVEMTSTTFSPLTLARTPRTIRRADPEHYLFALCRAGVQAAEQSRTRSLLEPGELILFDSSRPFVTKADAGQRSVSSLLVNFPKRLLPLPQRLVDRLLAVPLRGTQGIGRVLAQFLTTIADEPAPYPATDATRLGNATIDLVTAVLSHHLTGEPPPAPRSPQGVLFLRITAFIERHLPDPDLKPAAIASAHHISLRYLHRIFQYHGTSVAAHVKARRLDRCRRDLTDPALHHVAVHAIGARWGFPEPAEFSRVFRAAHGTPPGAYRITTPHGRNP
ncbi:helix-turn-helix domain-containing protein [Actinosynnema sp. NPDC023587]|uniref:AraC-like ligand-binding domain-containing protein n=1 Tax=Actinosynnema sp. NPDC023587 TaxID=3154695 RepID=UPI0033D8DBA3